MNGNASHPVSASSNGLYESDNPNDWQPYRDPEGALREAHRNLGSDEWSVAYVKAFSKHSVQFTYLLHVMYMLEFEFADITMKCVVPTVQSDTCAIWHNGNSYLMFYSQNFFIIFIQ